MSEYTCWSCKGVRTTENVEAVCIHCFATRGWTIDTMRAAYEENLAQEHENFLMAHRDNLKGANIMADLRDETERLRSWFSDNCGKIIVAMDSGNLSLAKHLLVSAMAAVPQPKAKETTL